jgi:hypothetical protein
MNDVRLDVEPLIAIAATQYNDVANPAQAAQIGPVGKAAVVLGIDRSRLYAWRRRGVRYYTADWLAIRLGYHPSLIWEEWWTISHEIQTPETEETHPTARAATRRPRTLDLVADTEQRNAS